MRWGWLLTRDGRALVALLASIVGAAVLTLASAWLVGLIVRLARSTPALRARALDALATSNIGLLIIIGVVISGLGLAINRRSLKASAFGASFEAEGGEAGQ